MLAFEYLKIDGDKCSYEPLFQDEDESIPKTILKNMYVSNLCGHDDIKWKDLNDDAKLSLDFLYPREISPEQLEKVGIDFYHHMPDGFTSGKDILTKNPYAAPKVLKSYLKSASTDKNSAFVLVVDSQDLERNPDFYEGLADSLSLKFKGLYDDLYELLLKKTNGNWINPKDFNNNGIMQMLISILSIPSLYRGKEKELNGIFKDKEINISVSENTQNDTCKINFLLGNIDEMRLRFESLENKKVSLPGYYKYLLSAAPVGNYENSIVIKSYSLYTLSKVKNDTNIIFFCECLERYCKVKGINPAFVRILSR